MFMVIRMILNVNITEINQLNNNNLGKIINPKYI